MTHAISGNVSTLGLLHLLLSKVHECGEDLAQDMPSSGVAISAREHAPARQRFTILLDAEIDGMRFVLLQQPTESPLSHTDSAIGNYDAFLTQQQEDAVSKKLSPRESEIARMVAKGYANKTIAQVLEISTWTVSTYVRRIFVKLGVCNRAAMIARLYEIQNETEFDVSLNT